MGCICSLAAWLVKYILFFANVLFVLSGIAIIAVGAMAQANFSDYQGLLEGYFSGTPIAVIVIGCLIFVIAFCGCCGAVSENRCLLLTYGGLLLGILLVQVGIGIWALTSADSAETLTTRSMYKYWEKEYEDGSSVTFDHIQSELRCCGVENAADYLQFFPSFSRLPASCCPDTVPANECTLVSLKFYRSGCYTELVKYINSSLEIIGIVAIAVAAFEVLAAVFAFCLASHIKD